MLFRSPSQSSPFQNSFSYFASLFPLSSHPRTNPIQIPSSEEPGNWTRKDVCPGSVMWSTLTPASLGRGLELEPSLPVPLAVVLRARLPGLCVRACVESLPSSFLSPLSSPTFFVLEPSEFNKNQYTWLPFHFCFCSWVYVGGWGTRGLEKEGAAMSPWITCSGDRKPPSSTHHLARPYIPSPPRVCYPSGGEGISRLKGPIQKSGYFAKPGNPASGCGSC